MTIRSLSVGIINSNEIQFLYGHLPFKIHNKLKNKYLFVTIVREPIQRCISHYKWAISNNFFSKNDDIDELFKSNKLPKNTIVNQFSGVGLSQSNSKELINLSLKPNNSHDTTLTNADQKNIQSRS